MTAMTERLLKRKDEDSDSDGEEGVKLKGAKGAEALSRFPASSE